MLFRKKLHFILAGVLLSACSTAGTVNTGTPSAENKKMVWYDGRQARNVWIAPNLVAEFLGEGSSRKRSTLDTGDNTLVVQQPTMRIWKVSDNANNAITQARSQTTSEVFTPVFQRMPGGVGPLSALPGGVVLILDAQLTQEQVDQWFADKQITVEKKLTIAKYAYFINTAPGIASLELANQLIEQDNGSATFIQSATPNWWTEKSKR